MKMLLGGVREISFQSKNLKSFSLAIHLEGTSICFFGSTGNSSINSFFSMEFHIQYSIFDSHLRSIHHLSTDI